MIKHTKKLRVALLLFLFLSWSVLAQDYNSGHAALEVWDSDAQANLPQWIKIWLIFMGAVYAGGLFFLKNHIEARWLVGGFIAGLLFSKLVIPGLGIVPLSGLVGLDHVVFWTPALVVMLKNRPFIRGFSIYNFWSGLATGCILFSFVFDLRDAYIYIDYMRLKLM